jgi:hypothetical protein
MKTSQDDVAVFREECLYWQERFGLQDWELRFRVENAVKDQVDEADVEYDCDTRHAVITYYLGIDDAEHPSDVALHEVLHLALADSLLAAVEATSEDDKRLGREEHRLIYRLMKVLPRKRSG